MADGGKDHMSMRMAIFLINFCQSRKKGFMSCQVYVHNVSIRLEFHALTGSKARPVIMDNNWCDNFNSALM